MINVFLVHGSFGKPFENWFPWLESELEKRDISCVIPTFPTPNHQTFADWEYLMDYYCNLGIVNSETILIGHSCGSIFLVNYLLKHKVQVAGLITVSGYNKFISGNKMMDDLNSSFYTDVSIPDIKKCVKNIISFYGNDDPNIPCDILSEFAKSIDAKEIVVPKAGHFNATAEFITCDVVLNAIESNFTI